MYCFSLTGPWERHRAKRMIDAAPDGFVFSVAEPKRSDAQNRKLWAMLSDIATAQPEGRKHIPEVWKNLFCHACGHAVQFEVGLNGKPFPVGFRTSKMSKAQMSDLIEFIYAWGSENGVSWSSEAAA